MTTDQLSTPLAVTVLGGTGYTGTAGAAAAARRGHRVTVVSRSAPDALPAGATHVVGSVLRPATLERAVDGADAVVSALSPRGELFDELAGVDGRLAELAARAGVRLGVIGGFSSLRPAPGAPRMAEGEDLPPEFAAEAKQMLAVLVALEATEADWFLAAPTSGYGADRPVPARGAWTVGDDVADLSPRATDLSAADLAGAVVSELEAPTRHRVVFSVTA